MSPRPLILILYNSNLILIFYCKDFSCLYYDFDLLSFSIILWKLKKNLHPWSNCFLARKSAPQIDPYSTELNHIYRKTLWNKCFQKLELTWWRSRGVGTNNKTHHNKGRMCCNKEYWPHFRNLTRSTWLRIICTVSLTWREQMAPDGTGTTLLFQKGP